jgi:transcriptional regulator with XRE-family HTH domain
VQKYENGTNRVSVNALWRIARGLGVPILAFFEGLALPTDPGGIVFSPRVTRAETREASSLARAFAGIENARLRRAVRDVVVSMTSRDGDE